MQNMFSFFMHTLGVLKKYFTHIYHFLYTQSILAVSTWILSSRALNLKPVATSSKAWTSISSTLTMVGRTLAVLVARVPKQSSQATVYDEDVFSPPVDKHFGR